MKYVACLVLTSCAWGSVKMTPIPASYGFTPPPIYTQWLHEAQACVLSTAAVDSSFTVVRLLHSAEQITWHAIPTEHPEGAFLWAGGWYRGMRSGPAGADTIYLSGQFLDSRRLVKHELMHVIVENGTELDAVHGRPWGLCEFV